MQGSRGVEKMHDGRRSSSTHRWIDTVLMVCIAGILLGAVFAGVRFEHLSAFAKADDPTPDTDEFTWDPFQPPVIFEQEQEERIYFREYQLDHITADTLIPMISAIGISLNSVSVDTNPDTIWARGTATALAQLRELIRAVDIPANSLRETPLDFGVITTYHITPERLVTLMGDLGVAPDRYLVMNRRLFVFDEDVLARWPEIELLAGQVDNASSRDRVVFVYELSNTAAEDAASRLEAVGFDSVSTQTFNYPGLSRDLMVICEPHTRDEVTEALRVIDGRLRRIRIPIDSTRGDNALRELEARRRLLSQISGLPESRFEISPNISGNINDPHYVMWVEETPETVKMLEEILARF